MDGVFGLAFGRPSVSKAVKIALGCSLAVLLARLLELSSATAVVTITLLSVQRTKKDTLRAALRRSDRVFTPQRVRAECDDAYRMWKRAVQRSADWIEH